MILDAEPGHGEGRLASACRVAGCATGDMVTMRYDADGRRVELVTRPNGMINPTTRTFRYQGDAIAQELTGTGTPTLVRTYVTDEAGTIVKVCDPDCTGTNPAYLVTHNGHGDALALWRIEASGSLTLANSYTYSTWGAPTTATHNAYADLGFRYLYVGASGVAWDNALGLGLLHMGARHYSPALGRFLQPDPSAAEPNLYAYGANSPVSRVDPSGRFWYRVQAGDTLQWLARYFLGSRTRYREIVVTNRLRIAQRRPTIRPGQCIWVPKACYGLEAARWRGLACRPTSHADMTSIWPPEMRGPAQKLGFNLDFCSFQKGIGLGLMFAGVGLEIASFLAEWATFGAATPFAAATAVAGGADIAIGWSLWTKKCR